MLLQFRTATDTVVDFVEHIEPRHQYAIVHHPAWNEAYGHTLQPSAMQMQNRPIGDGKGASMPVQNYWWDYIRKINTADGFAAAQSVGVLWGNNQPEAGKLRMVETVMSGGNLVAFDEETTTHIAPLYYDMNFPPIHLHPLADNWYWKPWRFWKQYSYDSAGVTNKILNGVDSQIPLLGTAKLWLPKKNITILPDTHDYVFRGVEIWDGVMPLMTFENGRVRFWNGFALDCAVGLP